jgi:hypothetical protein
MASPYEYLCTQNAHDSEALTRYLNNAAAEGWDLFAVTFAAKGEGGVHTMFWRRPQRARILRSARRTPAAQAAMSVSAAEQ